MATYKAGIIGLGFIGGADQVSGDVLGAGIRVGAIALLRGREPGPMRIGASSWSGRIWI